MFRRPRRSRGKEAPDECVRRAHGGLRLRVLRAVVAAGSIVGAASSLGYTPSAISQHLAALQRETGLTLLERVGRGVRPTAAGRTLADQADRVLERLGEAEAVVADLVARLPLPDGRR